MAALNAVAEAIAGPLSMASVFEALGRVLTDRLGIAGGVAFLQARPDGGLVTRANWDVPADALAAIEARLRAGWDVPAAVHQMRPADIVPDHVEPFLTLSVEGQDSPWRYCQCVPFWAGAGRAGVLALFGLPSPDDDAARTPMLELLGRLVGAAVLNSRLHAKARRDRRRLAALARRLIRAQEEERRRIARELHEEIAQALVAAHMSEEVAADGPAAPDAARQRHKNLGELRKTIEQVRSLTLNLRPPTLDDFGVAAALRSHIAAVSEKTGLVVRLDVDPEIGRLPSEVETTCFRVTQEAVANAVRHSGAGFVWVRLHRGSSGLELTVADDGRGFDVAAAAGPGFGLALMQGRASLAGGRLRVRSTLGGGTVVRMTLPIVPDELDSPGSIRERLPDQGPGLGHQRR